jgi:inner membrane protein
MRWNTHLVAGLSSLWLIEAAAGSGVLPRDTLANVAGISVAIVVGSLLPDLDASRSKIKHFAVSGFKPFLLPSQLIHKKFGHRSVLHSLIGLVVCAVIASSISPLWGWQIGLGLGLGYASHLLSDAMTKCGIPLLYPNPLRFYVLPKRFRLTTASQAEDAVFVLFASISVLLLLRHLLLSPQGFT